MITQPDGVVVCDKCEQSATASEESAEAEGWLIDYGVSPRKHFCPKCKQAWGRN